MSMLTVRDLDPEVKARLRERAARHGRSMEAEVRLILAAAVATEERPSLAEVVLDVFSGIDVELPDFDRARDQQRPVEL
jgi:plasmid stability protein